MRPPLVDVGDVAPLHATHVRQNLAELLVHALHGVEGNNSVALAVALAAGLEVGHHDDQMSIGTVLPANVKDVPASELLDVGGVEHHVEVHRHRCLKLLVGKREDLVVAGLIRCIAGQLFPDVVGADDQRAGVVLPHVCGLPGSRDAHHDHDSHDRLGPVLEHLERAVVVVVHERVDRDLGLVEPVLGGLVLPDLAPDPLHAVPLHDLGPLAVHLGPLGGSDGCHRAPPFMGVIRRIPPLGTPALRRRGGRDARLGLLTTGGGAPRAGGIPESVTPFRVEQGLVQAGGRLGVVAGLLAQRGLHRRHGLVDRDGLGALGAGLHLDGLVLDADLDEAVALAGAAAPGDLADGLLAVRHDLEPGDFVNRQVSLAVVLAEPRLAGLLGGLGLGDLRQHRVALGGVLLDLHRLLAGSARAGSDAVSHYHHPLSWDSGTVGTALCCTYRAPRIRALYN